MRRLMDRLAAAVAELRVPAADVVWYRLIDDRGVVLVESSSRRIVMRMRVSCERRSRRCVVVAGTRARLREGTGEIVL